MKIFVIGDSISIQYGPYLEKYLAGTVGYARKEGEAEALLNLDKPAGANGGDSSMVLRFVRATLATGGDFGADLLLVNCGLHDIKRAMPDGSKLQVPLADYEANLRELASLLAGRSRPRLVWIRTTPCDENVHNVRSKNFHRFAADCQAFNAAADRVMAAAGVPVIDLFSFTRNLGGAEIFCDHVHFKDHIRQLQAAFIAGWLDSWKSRTAAASCC